MPRERATAFEINLILPASNLDTSSLQLEDLEGERTKR